MSISSKMQISTPATSNKSNPLIASLSAEIGTGTRLGPDFSAMLRSTFIPPTLTPMRAIESAPVPTPKEAPPRAPEAARNKEQKPAAQAQRSNEGTAPKARSNDDRASDSTASRKAAEASDESPKNQDSLESKATEQTDGTEASSVKDDKSVGQSTETQDGTELSVAALAITMADPNSAAPAVTHQPVVAVEGPASDATALAENGEIHADPTRPQDLASLMPSVAKAVFGQSPGKQAVGDGKSDSKTVPTSTDERGKLMAAKAQDTAALLAAQGSNADTPLKDLSATNPELMKSLVFDKSARGEQPSFGKLMQAASAVTAPLGAPVGATAPGAQTHAPAAPVQIKSDIRGPAFAPEMAARLTVLTSAGVQKAELHLNPAEMGPVSVQIQMNGQEAQVNFHAQHAVTREVLERSLPELAAALRDAGMTLTGGGVFQQSNGARQDAQTQETQAASHGLSPTGDDLEAGVPSSPTARHTQLGVLDMYA